MNNNYNTNNVSESLNNKDVCYVLYSKVEAIDSLNQECAQIRANYYDNNCKKQSEKLTGEYMGYTSKVSATISKHNFKFKKIVNGINIEQVFSVGKNYVLLQRAMNEKIFSKIYYSSDMRWTKTEYFSESNYKVATNIIKSNPIDNGITLFTLNSDLNKYDAKVYYPIPYEFSSEQASLISNQFGESEIYVKFPDKISLYYENTVYREIVKFIADDEINSIEDENLEQEIISLDDIEELDNIIIDEVVDEEKCIEEDDLILIVENEIESDDNTEEIIEDEIDKDFVKHQKDSIQDEKIYTGSMYYGKPCGRGRFEKENGMAVYEGDFVDGNRNGFGAQYYNDDKVEYIGYWKDNSKHGTGIVVKDNAIKVSKWENGVETEINAEFDGYGNFVSCQNKNGLKITLNDDLVIYKNETEATVFDANGNVVYIGSYIDGKRHGEGTEFDINGEIIYKGKFKDDKYSNGTLYKKIDEV